MKVYGDGAIGSRVRPGDRLCCQRLCPYRPAPASPSAPPSHPPESTHTRRRPNRSVLESSCWIAASLSLQCTHCSPAQISLLRSTRVLSAHSVTVYCSPLVNMFSRFGLRHTYICKLMLIHRRRSNAFLQFNSKGRYRVGHIAADARPTHCGRRIAANALRQTRGRLAADALRPTRAADAY